MRSHAKKWSWAPLAALAPAAGDEGHMAPALGRLGDGTITAPVGPVARTGQPRRRNSATPRRLSSPAVRRGALVCLVLLAVAMADCARAPAPLTGSRSVAGNWRSASRRWVLDLRLRVRGSYVSGYAELRDPMGPTSVFNVTGEYAAAGFSLQFTVHDQVLMQYRGRLDASDTMRGVFQDATGPSDSLFFFRVQPDR